MKNIKTFEDFVAISSKTNEEAEGKGYKVKLESIVSDAKEIYNLIVDDADLDSWVQDKITIAEQNMKEILSHMKEEKGKTKIEVPIKGDMKTGGMLNDEE